MLPMSSRLYRVLKPVSLMMDFASTVNQSIREADMSKVFLDTNLIVYANDRRDPAKQAKAVEVVTDAMRSGGVISTQVLQEYAATAIAKLGQDVDVILRQLLLLETLEVVQMTPSLVRRSVELTQRYQVHFWDAGIIAAAEHANCSMLMSEDFSAGQRYANIPVQNPFKA